MSTSTMIQRYDPVFKIYKPSPRDHTKGSVSSWEYNIDKDTFWVVFAKQGEIKNANGNPQFDWENKEQMKLEFPDLGEILLLLSGKKDFLGMSDDSKEGQGKGLFHKHSGGNSILKGQRYERNGRKGILLSFSAQKGGNLFRVSHVLSEQEISILEVIIQNIIWRKYTVTGNVKT